MTKRVTIFVYASAIFGLFRGRAVDKAVEVFGMVTDAPIDLAVSDASERWLIWRLMAYQWEA
jgi:hypothetical protein